MCAAPKENSYKGQTSKSKLWEVGLDKQHWITRFLDSLNKRITLPTATAQATACLHLISPPRWPLWIGLYFYPLLQGRDHGEVSQALVSSAKFKSVPKNSIIKKLNDNSKKLKNSKKLNNKQLKQYKIMKQKNQNFNQSKISINYWFLFVCFASSSNSAQRGTALFQDKETGRKQ